MNNYTLADNITAFNESQRSEPNAKVKGADDYFAYSPDERQAILKALEQPVGLAELRDARTAVEDVRADLERSVREARSRGDYKPNQAKRVLNDRNFLQQVDAAVRRQLVGYGDQP